MGYALAAGTLAGVAALFALSFLYWDGTDICEQCQMGNF
jgi:hypothetical protein